MKTLNLVASLLLLTAVSALAKEKVNIAKDFDNLGGNAAIVERAKALDPDTKVQIVQNRMVDRRNRFEIGFNYGLVGGADSYIRTQNLGGSLDFHITPRWSVGARYYQSKNDLTSEGKDLYDDGMRKQAINAKDFIVPPIDYPIETGLVVVNFYPIYGKLNFFDLGVGHFDIYTLLGYGKMVLSSGTTDTFAAGGGVGFWLTQHVATRLELRYQPYNDQPYGSARRLDTVIGTASIGILL